MIWRPIAVLPVNTVIERQCAEPGPDLRPAGHHRDLIGGKQRRQHRFDKLAGARRELRRFQHHAVAGGRAVASGMKVNEKDSSTAP